MFYSHDLLGRKSPLGAIWTMAHGKKLSKCKILGINVADVCKHILQPEVPHSLRLQGILIGGVVIVFNKQQIYLLEDLQEMLRRVRAASAPEVATVAAVNSVLQKGRHKARVEAITMADMDMEQMLVLPTDALDQIQDLEDLEFFADPHRGRGLSVDPDGDNAGDGNIAATGGAKWTVTEELFMLPTLAPPSGTAAQGSTQQGVPYESGGGGRASGAADEQPSRRQQEIDPEELFDAPDLQMLMDGVAEGGASDAFLRALGGFGALQGPGADVAGNKKARKGAAKVTRPPTTATDEVTDTTDVSAATAAPPAAAGNGHNVQVEEHGLAGDMFEVPADLAMAMMEEDDNNSNNKNDSGNNVGSGRGDAEGAQLPKQCAARQQRRQRAAANEETGATATEEDGETEEKKGEGEADGDKVATGMAGEIGELQRQQGGVLSARRSPSVVPFTSVGQPPEHFMPPSPVHDGAAVLLLPASAVARASIPHLAASADTAAVTNTDRMGRGKRRRTSDEDNDSASEATRSLFAEEDVAGREQQSPAGLQNGQQQGPHDGRKLPQQLGAPKPKCRRPGARVTLDNLEEVLVRTPTYREWTLDSSAILGHSRRSRPAADGPATPTAYGQPRPQHRVFGALPPVVGASMHAAVVTAIEMRDADVAAAAVLHGPAAVLGGMGMGWVQQLVCLMAWASAADGIEDEQEGEAAFAEDAPRPKRQRATKAALKLGKTHLPGDNGHNPVQQQKQQQDREEVDLDAVPSEQQQLLLLRGAGEGPQQQQPAVEERYTEASDFILGAPPPPSQLLNEGMEMQPMSDELLYDEEIEFERLRRENTPNGSDVQRQLLHQQRAALGLTPGGSEAAEEALRGNMRATDRRSSQRTGSTSSSLGRESENPGGQAVSARRGTRVPLRFGTGALEDLLPAINEADGGGDLMMVMDFGEGEEEAPAQAPFGARGEGTSGGPSNLRQCSGARSRTATATATGGDFPGGPTQLLETYGPETQPQAHAFMGRHTQTVISIFRQRLMTSFAAGASRNSEVPGEPVPSLSFFSLAAQLQRPEAVKLFYQMLVTHTKGFVRAAQDESYGDIKICAGRYL